MPSLNRPQAEFLALGQKFKAFVAGFGSIHNWSVDDLVAASQDGSHLP